MQTPSNRTFSDKLNLTRAQAGTQTRCSQCGAVLASAGRFCPDCGLQRQLPVQPANLVPVLPCEPHEEPEHDIAPEQTKKAAVGTRSEPAVQSKTPPRASCHCGRILPDDAVYCPRCGAKVGEIPVKYRLSQLAPQGRKGGIDLTDDEVTIGKDPDCDMVLDADEFISRRHARVTCSNGMYFLDDLGSSNGTLLRVRRSIILEPGDEIVLGATVLLFEENR